MKPPPLYPPSRKTKTSFVVGSACFVLTFRALFAAEFPEKIEFNRDIRPILSNACFKCHGADVKNNQADLRLDRAENAYASRKDEQGRVLTAIAPGNTSASEVWRRITARDPQTVMPPPDALHQLSARDQELIRRWIEQGAAYQPHWAYVPPVASPPPNLTPATVSAARNDIDRFVVATLRERQLAPAPEADRRTLLRRVSLDLTGLPPTPEEIAEFLADHRPDAYERLVDRLLASPRYGERMAVPWLDVVRFADSVGFHGDQRLNNFPYRDYVIRAFNENKPFDQFTIEQLAGDLLPNPTPAQLVASGFNRLNMVTREGGAQPKEYLAKYAADRVRTVSTAWMGSTMACAECHDHKYDPFSARDFYRMAAYFSDIKQWGVYASYPYTPEPELAGYNNNSSFPPEIEVESDYLQRRLARFRQQLDTRVSRIANDLVNDSESAAIVRAWAAQVSPFVTGASPAWQVLAPVATKPDVDVTAQTLPDGSTRFANIPGQKANRARDQHELTFALPAGAPTSVLRVEAIPDALHGGFVTRNNRQQFIFALKLSVRRAGAEKPQTVTVAEAFSEGLSGTFDNGYVKTSLRERWESSVPRRRETQAAQFLLEKPLTLADGDVLVATVMCNEIGRVRFSVSPFGGRLPAENPPAATIAAFRTATPDNDQLRLLAAEYFLSTGAGLVAERTAAFDELREIADCRDGRAFTVVSVAREPLLTRVLPRGNWQDESGEVVTPAPPHFLPGASEVDAPGAPRTTRLDLARWLTRPDNPLTARTFANRLWQQFFGTGLSSALDDLGLQGETPSHPELLDWLAVRFVESGWDVKALVRLIVTSGTYRQSAHTRADLKETDPLNRLLAAQTPRRLEAEFVRDNALFAAGLLDSEIGGPSGRPYQPEGFYAPMNFPARRYAADTDDRQYRRGVYTHWQRTFLHPMLGNFDAPSREECVAARNLSTTPQQALTLLNDPTFVEAARALAERVLANSSLENFAAHLDHAFTLALARPASPREHASLAAFHDTQRQHYAADPAAARALVSTGVRPVATSLDVVELAAWTQTARVLLNLNETIVRY